MLQPENMSCQYPDEHYCEKMLILAGTMCRPGFVGLGIRKLAFHLFLVSLVKHALYLAFIFVPVPCSLIMISMRSRELAGRGYLLTFLAADTVDEIP